MTALLRYVIYLLTICLCTIADPEYYERLDLTPLPASVLATFDFRSTSSLHNFEHQHFRHIPRSLGQVLQHAKTKELHLRFSTGRWDDGSWGARPWKGTKEGGTGVELWAWIEAESDDEAFTQWIILNNALSGLFCASMNFIDSTRTTRPVMSFEPASSSLNTSTSGLYLLQGALPHEVVCTENLTPFLKLLPCKGKSGISTLLDGHKLFDASWQTMAIDFWTTCDRPTNTCSVKMEQTVDMVLNIERSKRPRDNPIPRPVPHDQLICNQSKPYAGNGACWPAGTTMGQSWSLSEIFGRQLRGSCLTTGSQGIKEEPVCLHVPHARDVYTSGGAIERKDPSGYSRCFTLSDSNYVEISLPQQPDVGSSPREQPLLKASRFITGHGQERGGIQTMLTNLSPNASIAIVYFESLPWFMKPYLHTLKIRRSSSDSSVHESNLLKRTYYRPALDRHRGTQLECLIEVPPAETLILTYDFDKAILRYTEYPPDANRGFDVAPAVIRLLPQNRSFPLSKGDKSTRDRDPMYIRTTTLLLPLPTPDFSMPYNVIILTSTVMALAFGSIFNFLVRRFVGADEVEGWDLKVFRERLKARIGVLADKVGIGKRLNEGEKEKKVQ